MTGQLPSATRGYDNAAYLASTIPTFAHYARIGGLPHGARRQDALRRARPAARLRGAAHHRHLPGRLRLDAGLAAARRAHRLVVPQHGLGHRRRRRRGHQPAAVRRRGRPPGGARAARPGARTTTSGRGCWSSASPIRTTRTSPAAGTGTSTRARDIPLPTVGAGRRAARPAHRCGCARSAPWTRSRSPPDDVRTRPARLLRQHLLPRRVDRAADRHPRRARRRRRHRRGAARRPRRHARRARPLVQDELLRGLGPGAADRARARRGSRPSGSPHRCRWSTCCRPSSSSPAQGVPPSVDPLAGPLAARPVPRSRRRGRRWSARWSASTWARGRSRRSS